MALDGGARLFRSNGEEHEERRDGEREEAEQHDEGEIPVHIDAHDVSAGDARERPPPALEGLLVADFTESLAGPYCAQILADLGADVVKVERPGGDPARLWGPPFWNGESTMFLAANRGKRSVVLDLKAEDGRRAARRLLARADVVLQSFRAGVADALGLGYGDVARLNPRAVYCDIVAFAHRGPLRERPGYDPILQAYAGLMSVTGHAGAPPARIGASVVDMGTGMWAAIGVLAALRERGRTGRGGRVVASLLDTALAWSGYHLLGYLATGEVPGPEGSGIAMIAPYGAFATADGWLMITAATDALFAALCRVVGAPALAADARFATNPDRVRHRRELEGRIAELTRGLASAALEARLHAEGVPCAPIRDMAAVAADPQVAATGMLRAPPHPRIAAYRDVALPLERDGRRPGAPRPPPLLGEHTAEVLRELGVEASGVEGR